MGAETWRIIPDFSRYEVAPDSRVRSVKTGQTIKHMVNRRLGYSQVTLTGDDGRKHTKKPHRLVAELFLPNPDGLREVNHIDGNKQNNAVENLEWSTRSANLHHAYATGLRPREHAGIKHMEELACVPCKVMSKTSGRVFYFKSHTEAANYFGYAHGWAKDIVSSFDGETRHFKVKRISKFEYQQAINARKVATVPMNIEMEEAA